MLGLNEHDQAFFVGIRSTFYRFAMITGQGLLVILAGYIESHTGLPPVEYRVTASPTAVVRNFTPPDSIKFPEVKNQKLLIYPKKLELAATLIPKAQADSIAKLVNKINAFNGFLKKENRGVRKSNSPAKRESWWQKNVAEKINKFIKNNFGEELAPARKDNKTGNVAVVYLRLAKPPGKDEEVVVNFGRESGDKSISLLSGTRFVFTGKNWNKPAAALIKLDPKLRTFAEASFVARSGNIPLAWTITFVILAAMFLLFFLYHKFILPYPLTDKAAKSDGEESFLSGFFKTFVLYFKKPHILIGITFILLYRLGESQLVKLASPFMLDARDIGGLGLTTGQVGMIYGTIGILALTLGGILGGIVAARNGLKYWLFPMIVAINIPDVVYVYLAYAQPQSMLIISGCVALEQFGYGFGFTAFMLYMIYISEGEFKTAHFAITTGFMALGMMLPGMFSGWLQELIGYRHFFIWVLIATIPAFILARFVPIDPEFGKKTGEQ